MVIAAASIIAKVWKHPSSSNGGRINKMWLIHAVDLSPQKEEDADASCSGDGP